jgi:Transglycosylase SLT domain
MPVKASYLALTGAGAIVVYSGIKGKGISSALRSVISGQPPSAATAASPITTDPTLLTGNSNTAAQNAAIISGATGVNQTPPNAATIATLKAYALTLLTAHGWPTQYSALNNIVMAESSWNSNALNASGAYGIAQALGHGTAATKGTVTNEYGNYGTSTAICVAANSGSGAAQLEWMLNYIGQAYGSPNAAWTFHAANGWY